MAIKIEHFVTLQMEGLHKIRSTPDDLDYQRDQHRHIFHIKAFSTAKYGQLKGEIETYLNGMFYSDERYMLDLGELSCAGLAELLMNSLDLSRCEVSTESEGAIVTNSDTKYGVKGTLMFVPDEDDDEDDNEDGYEENHGKYK